MNYRIRRGDTKLKKHYETHPANASYFSKTSQNEFLKISGAIILEKIIISIKPTPNSKYFFSIIADEAMDSSQKEQLSLVLRYMDSSYDVQEDFVGFVHLKDGLSGKCIADAIVAKIDEIGLIISNCRVQCYDGAGAVSGFKNGASAIILRLNRLAIYTHCFSHRLNLAVAKNFQVVSVNNMLEVVQKISYFFHNSEQRQLAFEANASNFDFETDSKKLKDPCKTRWVERIKDLDLFIELFEPLWCTLEEMKVNAKGKFNKTTQTDAFSYFRAIDSFEFVANLIITYRVLELSLQVTQLLQSEKNDIADGTNLIMSLVDEVTDIRENVDSKHDLWFSQAVSIANKMNIPVTKPRTNKRQIHRENHESDSVNTYFRVTVTIPILDTLKEELITRFSSDSLLQYSGFYLLPSKISEMYKREN